MATHANQITDRIITKLKTIPLEQQQQILDYVEFVVEKYALDRAKSQIENKKRVFGLHKGKIWLSDDFNNPLPDEFWGIES